MNEILTDYGRATLKGFIEEKVDFTRFDKLTNLKLQLGDTLLKEIFKKILDLDEVNKT